MPRKFILNASSVLGAAAGKSFYATLDEAMRSARFKICSGAHLVWIVDFDGNLVLSADQLVARLALEDSESSYSHSL
jgi:hypothetical protein